MTFLKANIVIEFNPISFRYINDWMWFHYSILSIFPLWIICIYRIYLHLFNYEKHLRIREQKVFNIIVFSLVVYLFNKTIFAPFYYLFDALISVWEDSYLTQCRFPYFYHHLIAIIVQPVLLSRYILNWWDILVCSSHAIFVKYPQNNLLAYFYVFSIFLFNASLYIDRSTWKNKFVGKYFPLIYYSFVVINFSKDCDSSLPYIAE